MDREGNEGNHDPVQEGSDASAEHESGDIPSPAQIAGGANRSEDGDAALPESLRAVDKS